MNRRPPQPSSVPLRCPTCKGVGSTNPFGRRQRCRCCGGIGTLASVATWMKFRRMIDGDPEGDEKTES